MQTPFYILRLNIIKTFKDAMLDQTLLTSYFLTIFKQ